MDKGILIVASYSRQSREDNYEVATINDQINKGTKIFFE